MFNKSPSGSVHWQHNKQLYSFSLYTRPTVYHVYSSIVVKIVHVSNRILYSMHSVIASHWTECRMGVMWQDLKPLQQHVQEGYQSTRHKAAHNKAISSNYHLCAQKQCSVVVAAIAQFASASISANQTSFECMFADQPASGLLQPAWNQHSLYILQDDMSFILYMIAYNSRLSAFHQNNQPINHCHQPGAV